MVGRKELRTVLREAQRRARRKLQAARSTGHHIDVASRTNIVATTHTGTPDTQTVTSARQDAPIRQGGADAGDARGVGG